MHNRSALLIVSFIFTLIASAAQAGTHVRVNTGRWLSDHGYTNVVVTHRGHRWTRATASYNSRDYHVRVNRHGRILRHRPKASCHHAHVDVSAPHTRVKVRSSRRSVHVNTHGVHVSVNW